MAGLACQIVALCDQLLRIQPSPVAQLNRAVAIAMCDGPEAGLAHIDAVLEHGELAPRTFGSLVETLEQTKSLACPAGLFLVLTLIGCIRAV